MKKLSLTLLAAVVTVCAFAAAPNSSGTYYSAADGKKGAALKTAMCGIIYDRTEKSYDYLWTAFRTTDAKANGKVWDMYSDQVEFSFDTNRDTGSGNAEGQYYNREHSWPQSWFGSNAPMYTDLHHIYPTDKFVNGKRSNYPFGETDGNTYKSHNSFSKLGACTYSGYTGTVFEPADEYKGDFARTYFYMVTCYEEKLHDWYTNYSSTDVVRVIDGSTYPSFQTWQLNMLLAWAAADPVSDKEVARNNAVYGIQGNRNPFIDYPGLEQYIWGSKTDVAFSYDNYDGSGSGSGSGSSTGETQTITINSSDIPDGYTATTGTSGNLSKTIASTNDLTIVYSGINTKSSATAADHSYGYAMFLKNYGYIYNSTAPEGYYPSKVTVTYSSSTGTSGKAGINYGSSALTTRNSSVTGSVTQNGTCELTNSDNTKLYWNFSTTGANVQVTKIEVIYTKMLSDPTTYSTPTAVTYATPFTLVNGTHFTTDGEVTLTSTNSDIATVSGLTVTPVAVGECIISVTYGASSNYNASNSAFTFTVNAPEGSETAYTPTVTEALLFGETFGNNASSARAWNDSYSVKSGISSVYSGITGYTITNAKQSKNNVGSPDSGLIQSTAGTDASIIIGPLNVADYSDLTLTYQWNAGSTKGTYTTKTYYATSSTGSYTEISGTGTGATSFVERSYSLPAAAQVSTLYLKIVWNTSNTGAVIDEVQLNGKTSSHITATVNKYGYATYCSQYPLDFSSTEGFTAWRVSDITSDGVITFNKITETIKGGQGVLLYNKDADGVNTSIVTINSANGNTEFTTSENKLVGTLAPTYVEAETVYGLANNKFVKNSVAGTISAGKAYILAASIPASVKSFTFQFVDDENGITETRQATRHEVEAIFNLAGQRMSKMQKGINIVNGKKYIIK